MHSSNRPTEAPTSQSIRAFQGNRGNCAVCSLPLATTVSPMECVPHLRGGVAPFIQHFIHGRMLMVARVQIKPAKIRPSHAADDVDWRSPASVCGDCHTSHHRVVGRHPLPPFGTLITIPRHPLRARESGKQRDANAQCPMANESALFRWSKTFVGCEHFLEVENRSNLTALASCGFFESLLLYYHNNDTLHYTVLYPSAETTSF